jgi:Zn-dependent protease with chaperone function
MPIPDSFSDTSLRGEYFDGVTSAAVPVTVTLDAEGVLHIAGAGAGLRAEFARCEITPPLGRAPRSITLPGGATIETTDFERLAEWERRHQRVGLEGWVHALESRWRYAALAAAVLVLVAIVSYVWGIPIAARAIAFRIPAEVISKLGDETLKAIEHLLDLDPSKLPADRQAVLTGEFDRMVRDLGSAGFRYRLLFRESERTGPNAFALPTGTIVVTDALVKLAERDEEVLAILAHEITHVEQRHGVRAALQNSGVFLLLALLYGDLASVTSIGATLPTVLAESNYSRDFEREADRGAAVYCRQRGWGLDPLRKMVERLSEEHPDVAGTNWISSHPATEERIRALGE